MLLGLEIVFFEEVTKLSDSRAQDVFYVDSIDASKASDKVHSG